LYLDTVANAAQGRRNDLLNYTASKAATELGLAATLRCMIFLFGLPNNAGLPTARSRHPGVGRFSIMKATCEDCDIAAAAATNGHTPFIDPVDLDHFWSSRPVLPHIHTFARARLVSPWTMLGCALVRVIAAIPPQVKLLRADRGHGSLNLDVGIVGKPGSGKGAAVNASRDVIDIAWVDQVGPGSGEGLSHLYMKRAKINSNSTAPK
jgi:hypothetical protein